MTPDAKQINELTSAIRSISHGGVAGPEGLEMLAIAVAGSGIRTSLAEAIENAGRDIREGLTALAAALDHGPELKELAENVDALAEAIHAKDA
jgi:hypothetical protein